jgi:S1-C subfamily serine protease
MMTGVSATPSTLPLRSRRAVTAALTALALVLAAACSDSGDRGQPGSGAQGASVAGGGSGSGDGSVAASLQSDFVRVVQKVRPSVVEISQSSGLGSGIVYDDKGTIVTNAHVVGNATQFKVTFVDGRTVDATLVGSYPPDDIAVVRVRSDDKLAPATFADSSKVAVGQIAMAIGNPLGLASSVTEGIVSSTGRTVSEGGGVVLPSTIQTSAPINPGNSGGALVGLDATVIGIPTLAATVPELGGAAPGIGFAIPSNRAKFIADQLVASGTVTNSGRAALGISAATVASRSGEPLGVLVRGVQPGGAAEAAGIAPGDIITAINEKPTPTLEALGTVLADLKPGDGATVTVLRPDGAKQSVRVTLGNL